MRRLLELAPKLGSPFSGRRLRPSALLDLDSVEAAGPFAAESKADLQSSPGRLGVRGLPANGFYSNNYVKLLNYAHQWNLNLSC